MLRWLIMGLLLCLPWISIGLAEKTISGESVAKDALHYTSGASGDDKQPAAAAARMHSTGSSHAANSSTLMSALGTGSAHIYSAPRSVRAFLSSNCPELMNSGTAPVANVTAADDSNSRLSLMSRNISQESQNNSLGMNDISQHPLQPSQQLVHENSHSTTGLKSSTAKVLRPRKSPAFRNISKLNAPHPPLHPAEPPPQHPQPHDWQQQQRRRLQAPAFQQRKPGFGTGVNEGVPDYVPLDDRILQTAIPVIDDYFFDLYFGSVYLASALPALASQGRAVSDAAQSWVKHQV